MQAACSRNKLKRLIRETFKPHSKKLGSINLSIMIQNPHTLLDKKNKGLLKKIWSPLS